MCAVAGGVALFDYVLVAVQISAAHLPVRDHSPSVRLKLITGRTFECIVKCTVAGVRSRISAI